MNFDLVESTLKSLLLTTVKITSKKRTLGTGQIQLFDIKDFNIKLLFTTGKKLEILYPFNVHKRNRVIYFDYMLNHIHKDDVLWKPRVNRMITNHRNKYCDLLLSIEKL
jgi:hypothetical protein